MADESGTEINGPKTRRGLIKHKANPFLETASLSTKSRMRRIADTKGEKLMVINENAEMLGPAGFWHTQEVDKTQFIKLYVNGVRAFKELTNAGARCFELLYVEMQRNIGKDQVILAYAALDHDAEQISERTFYRGMRELIEKAFIAESVIPGVYFVNPDYMWNGDRLAFVKDYRLKRTGRENAIHSELMPDIQKITQGVQ